MNGLLEGSTVSRFNPETKALTIIIRPAIYAAGRQSKAELWLFRSKKLQVWLAEYSSHFFCSLIFLGSPVEPEVFTSI